MLVSGLIELVVFGSLLFLAAFTFNYWQAWVFLVVLALSSWIPSLYLMRTNPVALQRRMRGGPTGRPERCRRSLWEACGSRWRHWS
jgi:hypothetical protein